MRLLNSRNVTKIPSLRRVFARRQKSSRYQLFREAAHGGVKAGVNGNPEIYMQMLLQMPGLSATKVFIRLAMNTNVPNYIVDQSLEALNRYDLSRDIAASDFYRRSWSNPKALYKSQAEFDAVVQRIDRAARNLQSLPSEVAIVALINALTTTGNIVQQRQQNAGIDSSGGAGLTTPGSVAIPVSYNHESVLFCVTRDH